MQSELERVVLSGPSHSGGSPLGPYNGMLQPQQARSSSESSEYLGAWILGGSEATSNCHLLGTLRSLLIGPHNDPKHTYFLVKSWGTHNPE
jgi:hypothetical protein